MNSTPAVLSPAFVADNLETLEELGMQLAEQWASLGGTSLELVPSLNALENVMLPLELAGHDDARKAASEIIEQVGLADRWSEVCRVYAGVNELFGDIVKVTPSSTSCLRIASISS